MVQLKTQLNSDFRRSKREKKMDKVLYKGIQNLHFRTLLNPLFMKL